jgi:hypothetical protein
VPVRNPQTHESIPIFAVGISKCSLNYSSNQSGSESVLQEWFFDQIFKATLSFEDFPI